MALENLLAFLMDMILRKMNVPNPISEKMTNCRFNEFRGDLLLENIFVCFDCFFFVVFEQVFLLGDFCIPPLFLPSSNDLGILWLAKVSIIIIC